MLFTVSSEGHKLENITRPPTHTNTSFLLITFLAPEIRDWPGTVNYVRPKISKPTQDACDLRIFSHAAHDFWVGEEERTSDLGTFLVGKVYHLAAYATALTHSMPPICRDASCSRRGSRTDAARSEAARASCLLSPQDGTAGRGKCHHGGCKTNLEAVHTRKARGTWKLPRKDQPLAKMGNNRPFRRVHTKTPPLFPFNIFTGSISSDGFRALRPDGYTAP